MRLNRHFVRPSVYVRTYSSLAVRLVGSFTTCLLLLAAPLRLSVSPVGKQRESTDCDDQDSSKEAKIRQQTSSERLRAQSSDIKKIIKPETMASEMSNIQSPENHRRRAVKYIDSR